MALHHVTESNRVLDVIAKRLKKLAQRHRRRHPLLARSRSASMALPIAQGVLWNAAAQNNIPMPAPSVSRVAIKGWWPDNTHPLRRERQTEGAVGSMSAFRPLNVRNWR